MPDCLNEMFRQRPPSAERPLEGQTVLTIEDSRFASEALRLLSIRSGARVRRADCLKAAARHLATYRPSVVIVDLGLPDGDGASLIRTLAAARPRIGAILAMSGQDGMEEAALAAGADGFLKKPVTSLALFQQAVLAVLPVEARPKGLRAVRRDDEVVPDRIALRDDLNGVAELLQDGRDGPSRDYAALFIAGLGRLSQDSALERAANDYTHARASDEASEPALQTLRAVVAARLASRATV